MPGSHRIHPERRLVVSTLYGHLTDRDLAVGVAALRADPAFDSTYDQLVDASAVTQLDVTTQGVRESARTDPFSDQSRRAIVVSDDAAYGLARMFQSMNTLEPDHGFITRDLDEAVRWLTAV